MIKNLSSFFHTLSLAVGVAYGADDQAKRFNKVLFYNKILTPFNRVELFQAIFEYVHYYDIESLIIGLSATKTLDDECDLARMSLILDHFICTFLSLKPLYYYQKDVPWDVFIQRHSEIFEQNLRAHGVGNEQPFDYLGFDDYKNQVKEAYQRLADSVNEEPLKARFYVCRFISMRNFFELRGLSVSKIIECDGPHFESDIHNRGDPHIRFVKGTDLPLPGEVEYAFISEFAKNFEIDEDLFDEGGRFIGKVFGLDRSRHNEDMPDLEEIPGVHPQVGISNIFGAIPVEHKLDNESLLTLEDLTKSLNAATGRFSDTMKDTVDGVGDLLKDRPFKIEHSLSPLPADFDSIFKIMKESLPEIAVVVLSITMYVHYTPKNAKEQSLFLAFLVALAVHYKFGSKIMQLFTSLLTKDITAQSPTAFSSELATILSGFLNVYLIGARGNKVYNTESKVFDAGALSSLINTLSRTSNGIVPIIESFGLITRFIFRSIDSWFHKGEDSCFALSGYEFIDSFIIEARDIQRLCDSSELYAVQTSLDRVNRSLLAGQDLLFKIPSNNEMSPVRMAVSSCISKLEAVKKKLIATNFKFTGIRQEPVSLMLRGPPGCGKSASMQHFCHAFAARTFNAADYEIYKQQPSTFIFNRQHEGVFWDGFDQSKRLVLFDDLCQARDVQGNPDNEIFSIIRAINVFEYLLHCAAIELKGNTAFRSQIVIANTNMQRYDFQSINEKGAFLRRWDLVFDISPKPEFCPEYSVKSLWGRMMNKSLLPIDQVTGETRLHPDYLEFHPMKYNGKDFVPNGSPITFEQAVELVIEMNTRKRLWHETYLRDLQETLEKYRDDVPQSVDTHLVVECEGKFTLMQKNSGYISPLTPSRENTAENSLVELIKLGPELKDFYSKFISLEEIEIRIFKFYCLLRFDQKIDISYKDVLSYVADKINEGTIVEELLFDNDFSKLLLARDFRSRLAVKRDTSKEIDSMRKYLLAEVKLLKEKYVDSTSSKLWEAYNFTLQYVNSTYGPSVLPACVTFATGLTTFGVAYTCIHVLLKFMGTTVGSPVEVMAPQTIDFGVPVEAQSDERHNKVVRVRASRNPPPRPSDVQPQSIQATNPNLVDKFRAIIKKNVFEFGVPVLKNNLLEKKEGDIAIWGFCTAIYGRTLIMPYHYMDLLVTQAFVDDIRDQEEFITLKRCSTVLDTRKYTVRQLNDFWVNRYDERCRDMDIAVLEMDISFQPVGDIIDSFVLEKQLDLYTNISVALPIPFVSMPAKEVMVTKAQRCDRIVNVEGTADFAPYDIRELWQYDACTSGGDCGALLFANDSRKANAILGMHIAGASSLNIGFSVRLTREFVLSIKEKYSKYVFVNHLNIPIVPVPQSLPNMEIVGVVPEKYRTRGATSSKITASPLFEKWGPAKTGPAVLSPIMVGNVLVDPMEKARSAYCKGGVEIGEHELYLAKNSLKDYLCSNSTIVVAKRILTFEEAVLGDESGHFTSVPRVTSAGFPWNGEPGLRTKERFFGQDQEYSFDSPDCDKLREEVAFVIKKAAIGVRCLHIFVDCLKDERRKLAKIANADTRMFSACPTSLLIAMRMYFGAFMSWLAANAIRNGLANTVCEYSSDWDIIARHLLKFGKFENNIAAGDFKQFDMSEKPVIHCAILEIINEWYNGSPEETRVREILWLECINSNHIFGTQVMSWPSSLPSGLCGTIQWNGLYNHIAHRLCWIREGLDISAFNKFVYMIVQGDDVVFSVSPFYKDRFNEIVVQKHMKGIGLTYTSDTKEAFSDEMRNIEDVTFLKRNFVYSPKRGRWIAPLDLDVILEIPYWVKEGANTYGDVENNVKIALEELSLHPREIYDKYCRNIIQAMYEVPDLHSPDNTEYYSIQELVLSRGSAGYVYPQMDSSGKHLMTDALADGQNKGSSFIMKRDADNSESFEAGATTRAINDAETTVTKIQRYISPSIIELNSPMSGVSQEVRDFLAKPYLYQQGNFSTTDAVATNIIYFQLPGGIFVGNTLWSTKLSGNLAWRATLVLTLQVNANRFQQGRYILAWCPDGGGGTTQSGVFYTGHTANLCQTTQLPHVELDLNCDTQASLEIPVINAAGWQFAFGTTTSSYLNNGYVYCRPYSPLVAPSGSTTVGYLLFAHWKDVEFGLPIVPQSGRRIVTRVKSRKRPEEIEQDESGLGPITSGLMRISAAASILNGVPLLSSVAGPVSWATNIGAKIASSFGWSKPHNSTVVTNVVRYIFKGLNNTDTADSSTKLAVFDSNAVEDMPSFAGSDLDELSIAYLASIPAWFSTISWAETATEGTLLTSGYLSPKVFTASSVYGTNTVVFPTPLAFVSNFFATWRGSIKLTFKIVKTEFHSGRLLFAFYPYDYKSTATNPTTPTIANTAYLHREIIDIRYGNEFTMVIPYMAMEPYKQVNGAAQDTGVWYLFVLNPLVAPATVSSSVSILIEASGGPDIEFAVPVAMTGAATFVAVPQAGIDNICEIVSEEIGNSKITNTMVPSRLCIGERVMSFRTLLKRFNLMVFGSTPSTNTYFSFYPFSVQISYVSSGNVLTSPSMNTDVYSMLSSCFALQRGSMRYKIWDISPITQSTSQAVIIPTNWTHPGPAYNFSYTSTLYGSVGSGSNYALFYNSCNGGSEVDVPYYNNYFATAVCDNFECVGGTSIIPETLYTNPDYVVSVAFNAQSSGVPIVSRAVGEDFNMGLFVSCPGIIGWSTNQY